MVICSKMQMMKMRYKGVETITQEAAIVTKNNEAVIRVRCPVRAVAARAHATMS